MVSATKDANSGLTLLVAAVVLAVVPFLVEGPSNWGKPETGYATVFFGLFMWPASFICLLIGFKRLAAAGFSDESPEEDKNDTLSSATNVPAPKVTDAWAEVEKQVNGSIGEKK